MIRRRSTAPLAAIVAVTLCTGLAACGRSSSKTSSATSGTSAGSVIATAPGFDGKTITLGIITTTSGPLAPAGAPILAGEQAWVQQVNAAGGIGGYQVKLTILDSAYTPAVAAQRYAESKDSVAMFASIFGTPVVAAVAPSLAQDNILAVATSGSGTFFRQPNLLPSTTPYESQVLDAVDYAQKHETNSPDTVYCGVGLTGELYTAVQNSMKVAVSDMGVKLGTTISAPVTMTDATPQVIQLRSSGCQVIIVQGVTGTTLPLMSAASTLGYEPQFITTNTGYSPPLKATDPLYPYAAKHLLQISDLVAYGDMSVPSMANVIAAHDKYASAQQPEIAYMVGYSGMFEVRQVLEKAIAMKDLSHAGIVKASASLTSLDFGGLIAPFTWGSPDVRKPPATYSVTMPDGSAASGTKPVMTKLAAPSSALNYPYK